MILLSYEIRIKQYLDYKAGNIVLLHTIVNRSLQYLYILLGKFQRDSLVNKFDNYRQLSGGQYTFQ